MVPAEGRPPAARPAAVFPVLVTLLACWGASELTWVPGALRAGVSAGAIGTLLQGLACAGGLGLAAAALVRAERMLAFMLVASCLPFLLITTKWALIAGGAVLAALALEALVSGATGDRLEPYDARVLAAAGASTLTWLLVLASSRMMFPHVGFENRTAIMGSSAMLLASWVPGIAAVYQVVRAGTELPEDRKAWVPLALVVFSLVRFFL